MNNIFQMGLNWNHQAAIIEMERALSAKGWTFWGLEKIHLDSIHVNQKMWNLQMPNITPGKSSNHFPEF